MPAGAIRFSPPAIYSPQGREDLGSRGVVLK